MAILLKHIVKQMECHGIRVGLPDHLPKVVQLLGHLIDLPRVIFRQFFQHVGSLKLKKELYKFCPGKIKIGKFQF